MIEQRLHAPHPLIPVQVQLLAESPELKSVIISSHGMLPILEILETCQQKDVIIRLLKIVNLVDTTRKSPKL